MSAEASSWKAFVLQSRALFLHMSKISFSCSLDITEIVFICGLCCHVVVVVRSVHGFTSWLSRSRDTNRNTFMESWGKLSQRAIRREASVLTGSQPTCEQQAFCAKVEHLENRKRTSRLSLHMHNFFCSDSQFDQTGSRWCCMLDQNLMVLFYLQHHGMKCSQKPWQRLHRALHKLTVVALS